MDHFETEAWPPDECHACDESTGSGGHSRCSVCGEWSDHLEHGDTGSWKKSHLGNCPV